MENTQRFCQHRRHAKQYSYKVGKTTVHITYKLLEALFAICQIYFGSIVMLFEKCMHSV